MIASRYARVLTVAFGLIGIIGCEQPNDKQIEPGTVPEGAPKTSDEGLNLSKTAGDPTKGGYTPPPAAPKQAPK